LHDCDSYRSKPIETRDRSRSHEFRTDPRGGLRGAAEQTIEQMRAAHEAVDPVLPRPADRPADLRDVFRGQ
jgi:hypothetical protein